MTLIEAHNGMIGLYKASFLLDLNKIYARVWAVFIIVELFDALVFRSSMLVQQHSYISTA